MLDIYIICYFIWKLSYWHRQTHTNTNTHTHLSDYTLRSLKWLVKITDWPHIFLIHQLIKKFLMERTMHPLYASLPTPVPWSDINTLAKCETTSGQQILMKGRIDTLSLLMATNWFVRPCRHITHASLRPQDSAPKMASRLVQLFSHGTQMWPTGWQTDQPWHSDL